MEQDRFVRGWKKMQEIDGEAGERVKDSLKDISEDLGRYIIEYSFGDVYSREGLTQKQKEIAVVAALTAMGNASPQLRVHLHGALNVGCSVDEVKEVILQMAVYAGFPAAINGMNALKEVLLARNEKDPGASSEDRVSQESRESRYETGVKWLSRLDPNQVGRLLESFGTIAPDLARYAVEWGYGDIYSRPGLALELRQIATIAALAALGTATPQLTFHINAGLNIGLTKEEIIEIMILMTVYAGFPSALNGVFATKAVLEERVK
jgi:4-carboxymuconolactone decarboxylase